MAEGLIRRGDFVTVAVSGDYGKPRPALAIQSDLFADLPSTIVVPLTTSLRDDADQFRLSVEPSSRNGLREPSQLAMDKVTTVPRARIGRVIGRADDALMLRVSRAMVLLLGIV